MVLLVIFRYDSWTKLNCCLNRPIFVASIALTRTIRIDVKLLIASTAPFGIESTGYSNLFLRLIPVCIDRHQLSCVINKRGLVQQLRRQLPPFFEIIFPLCRPDGAWVTDRSTVEDNLVLACRKFFAVHLVGKPPIFSLFFRLFKLKLVKYYFSKIFLNHLVFLATSLNQLAL